MMQCIKPRYWQNKGIRGSRKLILVLDFRYLLLFVTFHIQLEECTRAALLFVEQVGGGTKTGPESNPHPEDHDSIFRYVPSLATNKTYTAYTYLGLLRYYYRISTPLKNLPARISTATTEICHLMHVGWPSASVITLKGKRW